MPSTYRVRTGRSCPTDYISKRFSEQRTVLCRYSKVAPAPDSATGTRGSKPLVLLLHHTGMEMAGDGGAAPPPAVSETAALLLRQSPR